MDMEEEIAELKRRMMIIEEDARGENLVTRKLFEFMAESRDRIDGLSANQERFNACLSRMEIEQIKLHASLPEMVARAVGGMFREERA